MSIKPGTGMTAGQIRYRQEVHLGEHGAILDPSTWQQVQALLEAQRHRRPARLLGGALLTRLLPCGACGCAMTSSQTRKGTRHYRYYVCRHAQKRTLCPPGSCQ